MKHKTAELTGARLARAVAIAAGYRVEREEGGRAWIVRLPRGATPDACPVNSFSRYGWRPDMKWEHGGPIIDAKHFNAAVHWGTDFCGVEVREDAKPYTMFYGKDMLEAFMRALVWWKP